MALTIFAAPAFAQSTIDQFSPVPVFPFLDPFVTSENLWMTQNGVDYRATVTQLGAILQMNCSVIQGPFVNQFCWDTTTTPATLKVYQGGSWVVFPTAIFAPLNSPAFTGIPTAPTAPPGTNTTQLATTQFVTNAIRKQATSDITLYVAAPGTGTDTNNDCTVQANPCVNVQNTVNLINYTYDLHGHAATIQFADGNYSIDSIVLLGNPVGNNGISSLTLSGNQGSPDNVSLVCSESCFNALLGGHATISGMKLTSVQNDIWVHDFSVINFYNIDFGTAGFQHIFATENGVAQANSNYMISGGAQDHWRATNGGQIYGFRLQHPGPPFPTTVITLSGTPAFSGEFAHAAQASVIRADQTNVIFTGTGATGQRYSVKSVSVIETQAGGPNFLPGSIAGTADAVSFGAYN